MAKLAVVKNPAALSERAALIRAGSVAVSFLLEELVKVIDIDGSFDEADGIGERMVRHLLASHASKLSFQVREALTDPSYSTDGIASLLRDFGEEGRLFIERRPA